MYNMEDTGWTVLTMLVTQAVQTSNQVKRHRQEKFQQLINSVNEGIIVD